MLSLTPSLNRICRRDRHPQRRQECVRFIFYGFPETYFTIYLLSLSITLQCTPTPFTTLQCYWYYTRNLKNQSSVRSGIFFKSPDLLCYFPIKTSLKETTILQVQQLRAACRARLLSQQQSQQWLQGCVWRVLTRRHRQGSMLSACA